MINSIFISNYFYTGRVMIALQNKTDVIEKENVIMKLKDLPSSELPRERLLNEGESNLTNEELHDEVEADEDDNETESFVIDKKLVIAAVAVIAVIIILAIVIAVSNMIKSNEKVLTFLRGSLGDGWHQCCR